MNPLIQLKATSAVLAALALLGFALLPTARAVIPPPDGGYPGFTTAEGTQALQSLTTGAGNTGVGWRALFADTTGSFNTGLGAGALLLNQADSNTAVGAVALLLNTTGASNTAVGASALLNNTVGEGNTATGTEALKSNTTGNANTATGDAALFFNTFGDNNTANGTAALFFNIGSGNTAVGRAALFSNTAGNLNTATGYEALISNTTGHGNTATGNAALFSNTEGSGNTASGFNALRDNTTGDNNTAIGPLALSNNTEGNQNTALGFDAGLSITGSGNVCIGALVEGEAGVDDRTYIRNVNTLTQNFSAGVNDYVTVRLSDGRLGHTAVVSSQRYKEHIKPLAAASEALYALKPVSFRLKKEYDETQALGFGLIAEEVEKVDAALVYHNNKGQAESVRYEMVNAMLLNEFLKAHRKVANLEATVAQQQKDFQATAAHQQKQIEAVTAGLQKVSAQLEASKPAPQVVNNP